MEVTITTEAYRKAVAQVMEEEMESPATVGMGKILIPMVGMIFCQKVEEKLFKTDKEEKNNG